MIRHNLGHSIVHVLPHFLLFLLIHTCFKMYTIIITWIMMDLQQSRSYLLQELFKNPNGILKLDGFGILRNSLEFSRILLPSAPLIKFPTGEVYKYQRKCCCWATRKKSKCQLWFHLISRRNEILNRSGNICSSPVFAKLSTIFAALEKSELVNFGPND